MTTNLDFVNISTSQSSLKYQIERVIRWFDKTGDDLVGEAVLADVDVINLQKLFNIASDNPMFDCYLIDSDDEFNYLKQFVDLDFQPDLYDYFLECDAI
jgi:hypothetical protein